MAPTPAHLAPTFFIASDAPEVTAFAGDACGSASTDRERAVRLYYSVRDQIRYDPWSVRLDPLRFTATWCLAERRGFCIPKAALLAAAARAVRIPARLGFADVRNHLASPRLIEVMEGADVFVWHAYTELWLDGRWVKATPAFNRELCEKFRVPPLEFDGCADALLQAFNDDQHPFMEYVRDRGVFDDVPFEAIAADFRARHGRWLDVSATVES